MEMHLSGWKFQHYDTRMACHSVMNHTNFIASNLMENYGSGLEIRVKNWEKYFFLISQQKTYVVGTQKNHLNEMALLST